MTDQSKFTAVEKPTEFECTFEVHGVVRIRIAADTKEEASAKASVLADDDDFGFELDQVDGVRKSFITQTPAMYRVMRAGNPMQVSRVKDCDVPREADARGF